jgi:hypothetical protein
MNITGIVSSRVATRPFAPRGSLPALMVAFAALCGPAGVLAVPLLGTTESFVVLNGSSSTSGGAISFGRDHGASVGTRSSIAGGASTGGNFGGSPGTSNAGSAAAAFSAPRSMLTPSRNDASAHRDRAADIIAVTILSTLPCTLDRAGNSFGGLGATLHGNCTPKTTGLSDSDTQNIIIDDANSPAGFQIDSGFTPELGSLQSTPGMVVTAIIKSFGFTRDVDIRDDLTRENSLFHDQLEAVPNPAISRPGLISGLQKLPDSSASAGVSPNPVTTGLAASLPEPSTLALLGFGLLVLGSRARRR